MTRKFQLNDRVRKTRGASWQGRVCGVYSTSLTPYGYAVESEREPGSVQIYPEGALEALEDEWHSREEGEAPQLAVARAALEHDRSVVAERLLEIRTVLAGRTWLREGRGPFAWNDTRYQQEFGQALDEIEAALQPLAKIAADWSNCPTTWQEIQAARKEEK